VAVIESPTFTGMLASLQATGARVIGIPVDEHGFDVDALERVLSRHEIKLCALQTACQNPTGQDLSPERADRLLELARERSFFILEDGVYGTLRFEGDARPRLRRRAPNHVVYVDSVSKTVGGGLRVGWIAASGPILPRLLELKTGTDLCTSTLSQHLTARYLASGEHQALLERIVPVYRARRDALLESLERRLGGEYRARVPLGGHHVWVTFTRPLDERALYAESLRHGLAFTPGGATVVDRPTACSVRLSYAVQDVDALDEAVRRLGVALRAVVRGGRTSGAWS